MKLYLTTVVVLVLFSCASKDEKAGQEMTPESLRKTGQHETMEKFGEHVFGLIVNDQYTSIADLMPDLDEYKGQTQSSALDQDRKTQDIAQMEERVKSDIESLKKSYDSFKEEAEKAGIDWKQASLDYIDFKHERSSKIETADLLINFKYKGVSYKIRLLNCMKIGNNWLMGNQIKFSSRDGYY